MVIIKLSPSEVYNLQGNLECYIGIAGSRNNGNGGDTYITVNSARLHKATAGGGGVGSLNHGAAGVATVDNQFPNDTGSNGSFTPFYTSGLPSKELLTFPSGSLTSCMYDIMYKNSIFNAPYGKGADVGPYNGSGRYMPLNAGTGCIKITYFPPS